ncbi:hypothetical protein J1N35_025251, partial [Gossypium stocksii]
MRDDEVENLVVKDALSMLKFYKSGVVCIRNDSSSKVTDIDTVKIRIHNGTIRTLLDVRYVLDLRKNLISLSTLDSKGCRINIEASDIKVSRGALLLLKSKRTKNFYTLKGSIVTGETRCLSYGMESKSSRLEQRQLGHKREKSMTILLKK